jgi:acetylornithine deacetylase/succinyl-diaminopimelate desuccinylase-like protein
MRQPIALRTGICAFLLAVQAVTVDAQTAPYQQRARQMLERVVSFRSAAGQGQMAALARYMEETLKAGGVAASDIVTLPHQDTLALLVRVRGRDAAARPILFSSHMDIVDARPEDWQRSPFTLSEENGMFYGRGTLDNKTGVVSLLSTILRLHADRHQPRRTLLFAFIGDEETAMETTRLVVAHDWVRNAEFAINTDAGGGSLSDDGTPQIYVVQSAEKTYVDVTLVATNQGGHSSRPRADNAIYDLARALTRVAQLQFPVMANEVTRTFLAVSGAASRGEAAEAMKRFAANPNDAAAAAALATMPDVVGMTRTTCVATMIDGGHAPNALPQKVSATVNCRVFPGHRLDDVRESLVAAIADPSITVEVPATAEVSPVSAPRADVMAAITKSIHAWSPGIPVVPYMESGATDGLVYRNAGIPTWASSGAFIKSGEMFAHGLNERLPVASFYQAIEHIHDLAIALGELSAP